MTTGQRETVLNLMLNKISEDEFLRKFGVDRADGNKLSLDMLEEAHRRREPDDVEYGLGVGFRFGFSPDHLGVLCQLSDEEWHMRHEDIVTALGTLHDKRAVEA